MTLPDPLHSDATKPTEIVVAEDISQGAPPQPVVAVPLTGWRRIRFLFKVIEIRLRFILVLLVTFVLIGNWDTVKNLWDKWTRPATTAAHIHSDTEYFCPMHPSVVREGLEADGSVPKCPICNMPLSLRKKGEAVSLPEGVLNRVHLSPERVQMAGIATATVAYRPLAKEITTVGFVEYDESRRSQIVSRVAGFVEKLYVDKSYTQVSKGQPLAVLYSPDLASTAADLALSLDRGATELIESGKQRLKLLGIGDNEIAEIVASQQFLLALNHGDSSHADRAEQQLRKLGMSAAEIEEIRATKRAPSGMTIRSPVSGHVITKNIVQGARVDAGATLFDVADLSQAWIEAEVYESDIPLLHAGQEVEVTVEGLPNQIFHGQILLVHPHVEVATRTNRIRIALPNPGHALRPGMFASVKIKVPFHELEPFQSTLTAASAGPKGTDDKSLIAFQVTCPVTGNKLGTMGAPVKRQVGEKVVFLCCKACIEKFEAGKVEYLAGLAPPPPDAVLTVPESAVIDTGSKKVVYVEREPGTFDGIEVQLGPESDGYFPVVKGLRAGDRVAAAGAFLVDAETRLNPAAGAAYMGASGGPSTAATPSTTAPQRKTTPTTGSKEELPAEQKIDKTAAAELARPTADDLKNLNKLPPKDRAAALAQQNCPITEAALGSMGIPFKVELMPGKSVFLCCDGCRDEAMKDPQKTIEKLTQLQRTVKKQTEKKE
jgi:Cu(I)/Ag(I) efflux system membrane fusion protein